MVDHSQRQQARADLAAGLIFLAVAAVGTISVLGNDALWSDEYGRDPGPGLVPAILLALLGAGSVALTAMGAFRLHRLRGVAAPQSPARIFVVPALLVAMLGIYVWAMAPLGFVEATTAFAILWTILLGWQDDGPPTPARIALYVGEAIAIVAAIWFVFAKLILVPLP